VYAVWPVLAYIADQIDNFAIDYVIIWCLWGGKISFSPRPSLCRFRIF
jgi:hypothetical protein